jgi:protein-tyrosine kinase
MSIVEKALDKVRPGKPTELPQRLKPEVRVATTTPHRATESFQRSITLDYPALRAQGLIAPEDAMARVRHDFRRIKWPLLEVALGRSPTKVDRGNLVMVASSLPAEGKSFTSFNLAMSFAAERECSVLLVDSDIARPKVTRALGLEGERGLVDLLMNDDLSLRDVVLGTNLPGLSVLPAGKSSANGPELLAGTKMARICEELAARQTGQIVLFDSSPLLATNEAQVLSHLVGQIVMVVKANSTPRSAVKEAINLVSRTASVGLLLNQNTTFGGQYYGNYYDYSPS